MRRLVGMLRGDAGDDRSRRSRAWPTCPTLVDAAARRPVCRSSCSVDGERRELPVGIELSAYRVVQEGLTNALKHAGRAHAAVRVRYGPDSLELEIADDGAGTPADVPGGGHGLVGIRERVALYGGELERRPGLGGGFVLRVLLPTGHDHAC